MRAVQIDEVIHITYAVSPCDVKFNTAVSKVPDVNGWCIDGPGKVKGHFRWPDHTIGKTVVIIDLSGEPVVHESKINAEIQHVCFFPGKIAVKHLFVHEPLGNISANHIVGISERFLLEITAIIGVVVRERIVTQHAIGCAKLTHCEPAFSEWFDKLFFGEAPTRSRGRKETKFVVRKLGRAVSAEARLEKIF